MSKIDLKEWLESGRYLPAPLRDFHDQKDVFKTIHRLIAVDKHDYAKGVSWTVGQNYVIDIFLWFMAKRGYTLQKARVKADFQDLSADIAAVKEEDTRIFQEYMTTLANRKDMTIRENP